jgi:hypothetical protein
VATRTDSTGTFVFSTLSSTLHYQVYAADDEERISRPGWLSGPEVKEGVVVNLVLRRGTTLTVLVVDTKGEPLKGVNVSVRNLDEKDSLYLNARTSASGEARFKDLTSGKYNIDARGRDRLNRGTEVFIGRAPLRTRLTLPPAYHVKGRVVDQSGKPVFQAEVTAYARSRPTAHYSVRTAPDGSFDVGGLEPGPAVLEVRAEGFIKIERAVTAGQGDEVTVELIRLPRLHGRLNPGQGKAMPRDLWVYFPGSPKVQIRPEKDGSFELYWPDFRPGKPIVVAMVVPWSKPTWVPTFLGPFSPKPGERVDLGTVEREEGRALTFVVTGPDGAPLKDVELRHYPVVFENRVFKEVVAKSRTGAEGRCTMKDLPVTRSLVVAVAEGQGNLAAGVFDLERFPASPVALRLKGGGTLTGRIRKPDNKFLSRNDVRFLPKGRQWGIVYSSRKILTDREGRFHSPVLAPGPYRLVIWNASRWSLGPEVQVEDGKHIHVEVRLTGKEPDPDKE